MELPLIFGIFLLSMLTNFIFSTEFIFLIWLLLFFKFRNKKRLMGFWIGAWLVLMMPPLSTYFLYRLERSYLPFNNVPDQSEIILVLGSGGTPDTQLFPLQRLDEAALQRVMEGIRIWKTNPDSFLVFSSRGRAGFPSQASMYAQVALEQEVPNDKILLIEQGYTTETEVQDFTALFPKEKEIILVTSASHMPRAVVLFAVYGVHAYPAPTHYTVKIHPWGTSLNFIPSFSALEKWDILLHEYIGMLWVKVRFEIPPVLLLDSGIRYGVEDYQSIVKSR